MMARLLPCLLLAALALAATGSLAQPSPDFSGKTVTVYIGYGTGGGYDTTGRLLARFIGAHLPGKPTVIAANMVGAGSLLAANFMYNTAPKDGMAMGIVGQTVALEEALGTPGVQYHADQFNWIGRLAFPVDISITWHESATKTIADAFRQETIMGGSAPNSPGSMEPMILTRLLGAKFRVINGYAASSDSMLAMERREVDGATTTWSTLTLSRPDWLRDGKVNILVQYARNRHRELADTPTMFELARTEEERQILGLFATGTDVGRSFMLPPGTPPERVRAIRDGFQAMLKDAAFLAEIEREKIEFDPLSGEELQKMIAEAAKLPERLRLRAREVRGF